MKFFMEEAAHNSSTNHSIQSTKEINFFLVSFISFIVDWNEEWKKYYNSNLRLLLLENSAIIDEFEWRNGLTCGDWLLICFLLSLFGGVMGWLASQGLRQKRENKARKQINQSTKQERKKDSEWNSWMKANSWMEAGRPQRKRAAQWKSWMNGSPNRSAVRQAKAKTNEAAWNGAAELVGAAESCSLSLIVDLSSFFSLLNAAVGPAFN